MNIGKTIKEEGLKFTQDNLKNKDMIYQAYLSDINNKERETPRFFWCYAVPLLTSAFFLFLMITIDTLYFKSLFFVAIMVIINVYAIFKDYFGLNKWLTYQIIGLFIKKNEYSYFELLIEHYCQQEVSKEIKEEILNRYTKEDVIKLTSNGIIKNINAWNLN